MNKKNALLGTSLAVVLTTTLATPAMAAFILNGTRFIYEEGKKNISLEVTNNAQDTYGGQIWIDVSVKPLPPVILVPGSLG